MKNVLMMAVLTVSLLFANQTQADDGRGNRYKYQKFNRGQSVRIHQGIRNGSLTRHEARHLRLRQAKANHFRKMAIADGVITRQERQMIRSAEMRNNRAIYRQKHDNQYRRY